MTPSIGNSELEAEAQTRNRSRKIHKQMLDWLKTPSGAYDFTLILSVLGWLLGGFIIFAGLHLNRVRTTDAEEKTKTAQAERDAVTTDLTSAKIKIANTEAALQITAAELERTKIHAAELEKKLAPRRLSSDQCAKFVTFLAAAPKGAIDVVYTSPQPETVDFSEEVRSLLAAAGFATPAKAKYEVGNTSPARPPWLISLVVNNAGQPPYASALHQAFQHIGIDAIPIDGLGNAPVGEIRVFIGSR